jgi:hypothetical protein
MGGAFGDPDGLPDLAQPDAGILGDADEHSRVVGEERPSRSFGHLAIHDTNF